MVRILITYASDDLKVAEALRVILARSGADVRVDAYAKPGRRPAAGDARFGLAATASVLLIVNPRPESNDTQPLAAIAAVSRATSGDGAAPCRVFLIPVNDVEPDPEIVAALDGAQGAGALTWTRTQARLELLRQHRPATFDSMHSVREELIREQVLGPCRSEPAFCWTRFRYSIFGSVAFWLAPVVVIALAALGIVADVADSGGAVAALCRGIFGGDDTPPGHLQPAAEPMSPPAVMLSYTANGFNLTLDAARKPPHPGQTVIARLVEPPPAQRNFIICVLPDRQVRVFAAGEAEEDWRKPIRQPIDAAGVYTILAISTSDPAADAASLQHAAESALIGVPLALTPGVSFDWSGDTYRWVTADSRGEPVRSADVPDEDRWAIALRDALMNAAGADAAALAGMSFLVDAGLAGGG